MKHYIRTLGLIFSVALNIMFVGSYAYQKLTKRPTFVYEEIRLDPAQRSRMMSSRDRFLATVNQIGNRIIELQVELIDAVAAEPVDRSAIDAKLEQIRSQQQSMQRAVVEHLLEDKNILDPGQRKQYFAVLKQRIRSQRMPAPPWLPRDRERH
jgi:Spy/CpxP family protein refolding chaperone